MNGYQNPLSLENVIRLVLSHWRIPAACALACLLFAIGYILFVPQTWVATQAITVRDEAAIAGESTSSYAQAETRRNLQETILELGNDPELLREVLEDVGPPDDRSADSPWPSRQEVEDFSDAVEISPPRGSEFGTGDIFYIHVKSKTPRRAIALLDAIREQLRQRFQRMRNDRAANIVGRTERESPL